MLKKRILPMVFAALFFLMDTGVTKAQDWGPGTILINGGTGIGSYRWGVAAGYNRSRVSLPLLASLEIGVAEDITAGAFFGIQSMRYRFSDPINTYEYDYVVWTGGGKATYHATRLLNEELDAGIPSELDLYGSAYGGVTVGQYTERTNWGVDVDNSFAISFSAVLGLRYMLTDGFGVYMEAGRGPLGYLSGGVSLKL